MKTGVRFVWRFASLVRLSHTIVIGVLSLGLISCAYAPKPRHGITPYAGWPSANQAQGRSHTERHPVRKIEHAVRQVSVRNVTHPPRKGPFPAVKAALPKVPDAEYIREDELCMTCHEAHVKFFEEKNVHREFSCEQCHGPASEHVASRGQDEGKILNVKKLAPAQRSEICLRCHEKEVTPPHVAQWRTSIHANSKVSCSDCHRAHHDVPSGTPAVTPPQALNGGAAAGAGTTAQAAPARTADARLRRTAAEAQQKAQPPDETARARKFPKSLRGTSNALLGRVPDVCLRCHEGSYRMTELHMPHQTGSPTSTPKASGAGEVAGPTFTCRTCHDAQGTVTDRTNREVCLNCHSAAHAADWSDSTHNQAGLFCTDCHRPHPSVTAEAAARLKQGDERGIPVPMVVPQADTCVKCHAETKLITSVPNPHQVGGPNHFECSTCHNPHGKVLDSTRKDLCLNCHKGPLSSNWHSSVHNEAGLFCTDCHNPHPALSPQAQANLDKGIMAGLPRPMVAEQPQTCVKCHESTRQLVEVAGPHQVGGSNGFKCTTCHDPHGRIIESTRQELCLTCHKGPPTQAWHSSIHNLQGIKCTDCHDPHPDTHVQRTLDIRHTNVRRPQRMPMSVNDPDTCYKCHPQVYAQSLLPSHHPIFEGKMNCTSCHNSHGEALRLLNEPQVNLVCYKCHSEVQGPFVYEHPPVTQDCLICHSPHGSVQRGLLQQPTTFLCLRCHSGHRTGPAFHDGGLLPDIGTSTPLQKAFYTDCTQCHSQIHGSDVPSPNNGHMFAR